MTLGYPSWDAILLDVDNGPYGLTRKANDSLYDRSGLKTSFSSLRPEGILAIWSSGADKAFTRRLKQCGFQTETITVPVHKSGKGGSHTIWLESIATKAPRHKQLIFIIIKLRAWVAKLFCYINPSQI